MSKHYDTIINDQGWELPYEMWQLAGVLAKRRGEKRQETFGKIFEGLVREALTSPGVDHRVKAYAVAADRYCKAEGIENVKEYAERRAFLELQARLRGWLKELRAEPWLKDIGGCLD
jgi:hypothetical protein